MEELIKNPYEYIKNYAESVLMHVGNKAFSILALMPGSLVLPNIPFGASSIRSNINLMYIAPPSSGKSTLASLLEKFSFQPLKRRVITSADLIQRASSMKVLTLIIEDFSETSEDYDVIKVIEGIIGEEQNVSKSNMRVEFITDVKCSALLEGTPHDLEKYHSSIEGGLLSRCMILYLFHSGKQHSEIGKYINGKIGEKSHSEEMAKREKEIIDYYDYLFKFQENNKNAIKYYAINPIHKDKIYDVWKKISEKLMEEMGDKYWIRDLQDGYRILINSAFLNLNNRKHDNNTLVPNEEDLLLAIRLMKENMQYKWSIMKALEMNGKIKNLDVLSKYLNAGIPENVKNILINISPYARAIKERDKIESLN